MSIWTYEGKRVLLVGCHSGIGRATAEELGRLGAAVHGFDIAEGPASLAAFTTLDARDPAAIAAALAGIEPGVEALFYCAGLPQTFPAADVMKVNFIGARRFVELAEPLLARGAGVALIASTAGGNWMERADLVTEFVGIGDFAAAAAWYEARAATIGNAYVFSKEALIVWMMRESSRMIRRGIRLNCLSPGPTITGMTPAFDSHGGPKLIDVYTQPLGRRSTAEEQAYPLIFLNSAAASYVNGTNLLADAGFTAFVGSGQFDLQGAIGEAMATGA